MKVPINEKRYITITEAEAYFSIGRKTLRVFAEEHPELAFFYGNRWLIFREGMEEYLKKYGLGEGDGPKKPKLDLDPDEDDCCDWNGFYYT